MVLTLIAFAQRTSRPPQDPSKKKTEFRHSFFRADYLVSKTLTRFLEQDKTMIDVEATKLKVTAADLYYDKSSDYKLERDIYPWIKNKYLVSDDRQIELLDSVLNLNKKWKNAIIEQGVLEEIMNPINGKYKFRVENKAIYALSSRSQNGYNQNIYKFEFDKNYRILSENLGQIEYGDSLYWTTTNYEYKGKYLHKEVYKKCNEIRCKRGYEEETTIYEKGRIVKHTKQVHSRKDNLFIKDEVTNYFYSGKTLDSTVTKLFNIVKESPKLENTKVCTYENEKITTITETWVRQQVYRDQRSFTENKYDKNGRLVMVAYKGWNAKGEVAEVRTEELAYYPNKYVYKYIQTETTKRRNGRAMLPLQYEMTYILY